MLRKKNVEPVLAQSARHLICCAAWRVFGGIESRKKRIIPSPADQMMSPWNATRPGLTAVFGPVVASVPAVVSVQVAVKKRTALNKSWGRSRPGAWKIKYRWASSLYYPWPFQAYPPRFGSTSVKATISDGSGNEGWFQARKVVQQQDSRTNTRSGSRDPGFR